MNEKYNSLIKNETRELKKKLQDERKLDVNGSMNLSLMLLER